MRRTGLGLFIVGLIITAASLTFYFLLPYLADQRVASQIVIDSTDHPAYTSQFLTNSAPEAPPKYNKLFFFHLENPQEFLAGQKPRYSFPSIPSCIVYSEY
jgi:hypothetical protein